MTRADSPHARPAYGAFLRRLADKPMLVITSTFVLTAFVTIVVLVAEPASVDVLGVVSLLATLWGLTLAVVIYLLTAQDTNRVLGQIGDLQEQLSAALAEPDATDTPGSGESPAEPAIDESPSPAPAEDRPDAPVVVGRHPQPHEPARTRRPSTPQSSAHGSSFYVAGTGIALEDRVPLGYIEAWQSATGLAPERISRAWTRGHSDRAPWVLMSDDGSRWSVYSSGDGVPSVIRLASPGGGRPPRVPRGGPRSHDPRAQDDR